MMMRKKRKLNGTVSRIVRMYSWGGRTTISGEWIGSDYDSEMVVEFMQDMVKIMLSIIED